MKTVIDVVLNKKLKTSDVLVFKDGVWTNVPKNVFLNDLIVEQKRIEQSNEEFKRQLLEDFDEFKEKTNGKLKAYHEVLKTLVNK